MGPLGDPADPERASPPLRVGACPCLSASGAAHGGSSCRTGFTQPSWSLLWPLSPRRLRTMPSTLPHPGPSSLLPAGFFRPVFFRLPQLPSVCSNVTSSVRPSMTTLCMTTYPTAPPTPRLLHPEALPSRGSSTPWLLPVPRPLPGLPLLLGPCHHITQYPDSFL